MKFQFVDLFFIQRGWNSETVDKHCEQTDVGPRFPWAWQKDAEGAPIDAADNKTQTA